MTPDSVLFLGFGAPSKPSKTMEFLRIVTRERPVPEDRLLEVAHHYELIGGSPYNALVFQQAVALRRRLRTLGLDVPVYAGMRNWTPFLPDVVRVMSRKGKLRPAVIPLASAGGGEAAGRYRQDLAVALGANPDVQCSPRFVRGWFDDPQFARAAAGRIEEASGESRGRWPAEVPILFTAHSIPCRASAGTSYVDDLLASCRATADVLGVREWRLVYQSRSGDPRTPWLEPDICDALREVGTTGVRRVVVQPIGFLQDHVEVLFDLDLEAADLARELGVTMHRAGTVGDHPEFIDLLARRVMELCE